MAPLCEMPSPRGVDVLGIEFECRSRRCCQAYGGETNR